ncbi:50S ribosomal protein L24 [candidate division WOR-1 bacterium RIFOXYD2_FULL_36_8]|uniref:Large ribosomal subunit protein uL24 n=1 Tax=candidate division WOR-1 bacterium RIFOXYB2_FULL_36_35 TaxID=1802578 RepID=A0A1F4S513_UNCSA|nr:MAG: 50S ribosomal protein L24 [candidate division WOR-1 bacterium RIFOXYA2_FULL_36_21]OGC15522.1 MAG: 50S ribosomal protein L24 [candidate division WOR-1 bacterium RIFOXYB2_FULL_36_35]OGC21307.1 MAG: 50S ribosomal protein L24 [candidate division WOR-1 bacterium RIFOXYA12_FULL_36_13]OGC38396.1 MAG: 50S ribosomal protein L24 [candidate division WOR-1 bacterium RIFOXYD2_FULL_36_8]
MYRVKVKNKKLKIKKDDKVLILAGKDKGKKGKVLRLLTKSNRAIVEGINIVKKHQKPTRNFQGGIIEKPGSIDMSNLMVVCSKCNEPSRLGKDKEGLRICKKCEAIIDKS